MFWTFVVFVGLIGTITDIVLSRWSETNQLSWWLIAAIGYLVFMTGLGIVIRVGSADGFWLTIAVLLVVLVNIAGLAVWDTLTGRAPSALQWAGVVLAIGAVACLELGRS